MKIELKNNKKIRDMEANKKLKVKQKGFPIRLSDKSKFATQEKTWEFFHEMGYIRDNTLDPMVYQSINDCWRGEPCYIVGGGPSLKEWLGDFDFEWLRGRHTIGINHMIEDWDGFEFFFFLDKRFLAKCQYDLDNYKGRIFAQNNTGMYQSDNVTLFKCRMDKPSKIIQNGLFSSNFSGLSALNLAIITGADPIYLLGYDNGTGASHEGYHYKPNYTGEIKSKKRFGKFQSVMRYFYEFLPYKNRIRNVSEGVGHLPFDRMPVKQFKQNHKHTLKVNGRPPKIIHLSFSDRIDDHADTTRAIIKRGFGIHKLNKMGKSIPNADLYILEHFQSTDAAVRSFPLKHKAINIVHTVNCISKGRFYKTVALTEAWKTILEQNGVQNIEVIKGGIDLIPYKNIMPSFSNKTFGRITRYSPAKIHAGFNGMASEILEEIPESKLLMYCDFRRVKGRPRLEHERATYDESVKINMFKGNALSKLSVYVHANGGFKETMSYAVIEAMATGLPVVYLAEGTGVIEEVTGWAGIKCNNLEEVKQAIKIGLTDLGFFMNQAKASKRRALDWNIDLSVRKFDGLVKKCLERR